MLEVHSTADTRSLLRTKMGGFGQAFVRFVVGVDGLLLSCGRNGFSWHLFDWSSGKLEWCTENRRFDRNNPLKGIQHPHIAQFTHRLSMSEAAAYSTVDAARWNKCTHRHLARFALDRFGRAWESSTSMKTLSSSCSPTAIAGPPRLPDGTRHGVGMVHRWPNSPDALRKMGEVLQALT